MCLKIIGGRIDKIFIIFEAFGGDGGFATNKDEEKGLELLFAQCNKLTGLRR